MFVAKPLNASSLKKSCQQLFISDQRSSQKMTQKKEKKDPEKNILQTAKEANLDPFVINKLSVLYKNMNNSRFEEILKKVAQYKWFLEQKPNEQLAIIYMLNGISIKASSTKGIDHQAVLTHTLNFIVNGYFPLVLNKLETANGLAYLDRIEINSIHFEGETYLNSYDARIVDFAARVLAHEVSHTISGQKADYSYEYFIEEYRAFQVGHFAQYGQKMNDQEALRSALFILTVYETIKFDFLRNADQDNYRHFFRLFWQNTSGRYTIVSDSIAVQTRLASGVLNSQMIEALVSESLTTQVGPEFGWDGFLTNSPKPDHVNKFLQEQIIKP